MSAVGSVSTFQIATLEQDLNRLDHFLDEKNRTRSRLNYDEISNVSGWNKYFIEAVRNLPPSEAATRIHQLFNNCIRKSSALGLESFNNYEIVRQIHLPNKISELEAVFQNYEAMSPQEQGKIIQALFALHQLFQELRSKGNFDLADPFNMALANRFNALRKICEGPGLVHRYLSQINSSYVSMAAGLCFGSWMPAVLLGAGIEFTKLVTAVRTPSTMAIASKTAKAAWNGLNAHHTMKALIGDSNVLVNRSHLILPGLLGGANAVNNAPADLGQILSGVARGIQAPIHLALICQIATKLGVMPIATSLIGAVIGSNSAQSRFRQGDPVERQASMLLSGAAKGAVAGAIIGYGIRSGYEYITS